MVGVTLDQWQPRFGEDVARLMDHGHEGMIAPATWGTR
jgi:hypothetical protein